MEQISFNIRAIQHDGEIQIATGRSKKETKWKNKTVKWSKLVEKLSETTRTPETYAEYQKMPKADRDNIKDVGGFVGGTLKNGRRKAENVANRSIITLDIDFATNSMWDIIQEKCKYSCVLYSTHSHTPENCRYRLLIPLTRPVLADEYQAIARLIAQDIGIDLFDDTTYQAHRLMYWPSTSHDAEYVFKYQDLEFLNPDDTLARYLDWHDVSYWPESSRSRKKLSVQIKKQENPLTKKGIIGAFCRTYTISEAIDKFLSDVYLPGADNTRYTYAEGSTAGGVVVYNNMFSYSHHGTDPASEILCNAFDLVRIHLFGNLDQNYSIDTDIKDLPSFRKMQEFAAEDESVRYILGKEKLNNALNDFDVIDDENEKDDTEWLNHLEYTQKGSLKSTIDNILLIIENDQELKAGKIQYDEFANRSIAMGELPWRKKDETVDWKDSDDAGLRHFLEKKWSITSVNKTNDALTVAFEKHRIHPVRDYLDSISWDGVKRVDTLLIDYLGAADTNYTRVVTRKELAAAVARIYNPGIKFDNMIVLAGKTGVGKSTLVRKLGKTWFSDSLTTLSGKEAYEGIQGVWILELGELTQLKKSDVEATKQFLSKTEDIYRVAYGRRTSRFPRQCVFFGTTNDREFLRDKTGNRRFWPVDILCRKPTKSVFKDLDDYEIDQIWAEAKELFNAGETLYLDHDEEKEAVKQQNEHMEDNTKVGYIKEFLDKPITKDWYGKDLADRKAYFYGFDNEDDSQEEVSRDRTCIMEIWCELFGGDAKNLTNAMSREIGDILKTLPGWKRSKPMRFGKAYGQQRAFVRVNDDARKPD